MIIDIDVVLAKVGLVRKSVAERRVAEVNVGANELALYVSKTLGRALHSGDCPEIPVDPPAGARSEGMSQEEYVVRSARHSLVVAAAMLGARGGHGIAMDLPISEEARTSIHARYAPTLK